MGKKKLFDNSESRRNTKENTPRHMMTKLLKSKSNQRNETCYIQEPKDGNHHWLLNRSETRRKNTEMSNRVQEEKKVSLNLCIKWKCKSEIFRKSRKNYLLAFPGYQKYKVKFSGRRNIIPYVNSNLSEEKSSRNSKWVNVKTFSSLLIVSLKILLADYWKIKI